MNRGLNALTIIAVFMVFAVALGLPQHGIAMLPGWVYYIGITLMLLGVAVRQWAIAVLGRYFSAAVGIQKDHKIVQTGPYRLVRASLVHGRSPDGNRNRPGLAILGSRPDNHGHLRSGLWLQDARRRKGLALGAWQRLCRIHETDEEADPVSDMTDLAIGI
jgi:hypothetical protein